MGFLAIPWMASQPLVVEVETGIRKGPSPREPVYPSR